MTDDLTTALLALSDQVMTAWRAAKAAGDSELAQVLYNMAWTVAQSLARRARQIEMGKEDYARD